MDVEALEEFLRFWVAFTVVDEDGVGSVSVGDLKARGLLRCTIMLQMFVILCNVRFRRSGIVLMKRARRAPKFGCLGFQEALVRGSFCSGWLLMPASLPICIRRCCGSVEAREGKNPRKLPCRCVCSASITVAFLELSEPNGAAI